LVAKLQQLNAKLRTVTLGREKPQLQTTLMMDPGECRQHALDCVRLAQTATTPEARKIWSDLAKTWLMFASDLEANERVLEEWGRPKPKKHQTIT
jgi:hypothetical protein